MSKDKKKKSGMGKFVLGAAIGGTLGVLFAPKKGSETRKDLKEKIDDLIEKTKNIEIEEVKENINNKIEEIKEELKDLDKEKVLKIAKEKGKVIMNKTEELVKLAVEKGTPILEKSAKSLKSTTVNVVENILDKLKKEN